ncbi:MAG: oligogalacturonate lyase family protein [Lachnospiraceae bacterium]
MPSAQRFDRSYAKPDTRIIRIDVENGKMEELWQEKCWIGHVNPSLTQPILLTFCHEGPWNLADHRIWVMDTKNGTPSPSEIHCRWKADSV